MVVEWLFEHPAALAGTLIAAAGLFCLWLFGPISWRNSEGSVTDDGRNFADVFWALFDP
ncbi:MAG: hypothetical protein V4671_27155 [Armatimonadota bacterium]